MEMKGLSSYSGNEAISDKRQQVPVYTINVVATSTVNSASSRSGDSTQKNTDLTQFRQPNASQQQSTPSLPPMLPPVNILQFLGGGFERLVSLAASFFKGNQRDTVDEDFEDRWEQNEIAHPDLFAQQAKVQDAKQSNLGGDNQ